MRTYEIPDCFYMLNKIKHVRYEITFQNCRVNEIYILHPDHLMRSLLKIAPTALGNLTPTVK